MCQTMIFFRFPTLFPVPSPTTYNLLQIPTVLNHLRRHIKLNLPRLLIIINRPQLRIVMIIPPLPIIQDQIPSPTILSQLPNLTILNLHPNTTNPRLPNNLIIQKPVPLRRMNISNLETSLTTQALNLLRTPLHLRLTHRTPPWVPTHLRHPRPTFGKSILSLKHRHLPNGSPNPIHPILAPYPHPTWTITGTSMSRMPGTLL